MAMPLLLTDNLFDVTVLHRTHALLTSGDEAPRAEPWRVADNLRDMTAWTPGTTNVERSLVVDAGAGATISATMLVFDRGHNLGGRTVYLDSSTDPTFATNDADAVVAVIPSAAGGLPTDANGCLTPEGVWWKTFTPPNGARRAWRLRFPAYGVGIAPLLTGVYLGTAYRFPEYLDATTAYDYRRKLVHTRNVVSRGGVRTRSRPLCYDELDLSLRLEGSDYASFDAEIDRMLRYGAPAWFCLDDATSAGAQQLRLFQVPGDLTYDPVPSPVHREIRLLLEEVIPELVV